MRKQAPKQRRRGAPAHRARHPLGNHTPTHVHQHIWIWKGILLPPLPFARLSVCRRPPVSLSLCCPSVSVCTVSAHATQIEDSWPLQDIVSLRGFMLYCTIIFFANTNTPFIVQYILRYITPVIAPIRPVLSFLEVFGVFFVFCLFVCLLFGGVFCSFRGRIWDGSRCLKKNPFSTRKRGIIAHYCVIPPSQPPFIAYNIAQYIFPTTPFIATKNIGKRVELSVRAK